MTEYTELKRLAEQSKDSWVNGKWHTRPTLDIGVDEDDSAYIVAASPDVVLSMIAEIEETTRLRDEWKREAQELLIERDTLLAQNKALELDAKRYQCIRNPPYSDNYGDLYAMTFQGDGDVPIKGEVLDGFVDAKLAQAEGGV